MRNFSFNPGFDIQIVTVWYRLLGRSKTGRLLNTLNKNYMEFSFGSSYQLSLSDPDILFAYHIQAFVASWQNLWSSHRNGTSSITSDGAVFFSYFWAVIRQLSHYYRCLDYWSLRKMMWQTFRSLVAIIKMVWTQKKTSKWTHTTISVFTHRLLLVHYSALISKCFSIQCYSV